MPGKYAPILDRLWAMVREAAPDDTATPPLELPGLSPGGPIEDLEAWCETVVRDG